MCLKIILVKHAHSLITFGIVLVTTLAGYGLYALLLMAGFWLGREHSQAEYRYIKLHSITRDGLKWYDSLKKEAWNYDSLINDLVLPIAVGVLLLVAVNIK